MNHQETTTKVFEKIGELALHAALVDVIVPAAAIDKQNFHADVRLQELADALASGAKGLATPGVSAHLRATTLEKLRVDQPNYSGYRAALATPDIEDT